jgi:hypothetical protein
MRTLGCSLGAISLKLKVSKGTIYYWCRSIELNAIQKQNLLSRINARNRGGQVNRQKRLAQIEKIREEAGGDIKSISNYDFFIAGIMLYWAEGNKTQHVGITNSDENLIVFMVKWFNHAFGITPEQLTAHLHLHSNHDESQVISHWSAVTGIPTSRFRKTFYKPEGTGHRTNKLPYGTIRISFYKMDFLHKILAWKDRYVNLVKRP